MISKERAEEIRRAYDANDEARKKFDPKRYKRGGGYGPEEVRAIEQAAGVRKPTNEELADLETYDFMTTPPEHVFAYYKENARVGEPVTGFMSNVLGTIIWRGVETRPMGGRVVSIRMRGENGYVYAGKCNLSSGTYCRLKRGARSASANPLEEYTRVTKDEWSVQGNYGYGHGWEDVTSEDSRKEILQRLREYRENEPGVPFRLIKRRVRIAPSSNPISPAATTAIVLGGAVALAAGLYYALSAKPAVAAAQPITTGYRGITITATQTSPAVWTARAPNPMNPTNTIVVTGNSSDAAISSMKLRIDNVYEGMTA